MELFNFVIIALVRGVLLREILIVLFPHDIFAIDLIYLPEVLPPLPIVFHDQRHIFTIIHLVPTYRFLLRLVCSLRP